MAGTNRKKMKRVQPVKKVKRAEECAEYKGSLPVDELLNYINDPKSPASNSCYPSNTSQIQMSESKNNKKIRKKYSKDSVQNANLSCNSNNHSLSCVKDPMKGEIVRGFSENSKCDQTVQNLVDDIFLVNDVDVNVVNNHSPELCVNGSHGNPEMVHYELSTTYNSYNKSKVFVPKGSYVLTETEDGGQRNLKVLNGNLNGFSSSSNESGCAVWMDQNADECLLANVPQESFESCQSSLQSSLSSISSSLSSNKADNHDDVKLTHADYHDISYASSFLHKSVSADDSKGAKLDVLSSFDEDYEVCLPSNHQHEMIEENNDISVTLLGYPPNQNELKSFTVSSCTFTEFEKEEAPCASSNFRFGDLSVSRAVLESSGNENLFMESSNAPSVGASAFHGCKKANPCEIVTYITSSVVSSRCDDTSNCLKNVKRFEKHHFNLSKKPVRAPVEFVNCPVEDLSSQNSLGISFGFGLEDLLEKCTSSGTGKPDLNCTGSSSFENATDVCPDINLSLKTSFVTTCLSSAVSFNWSSLSSTFVDVNANINLSTSTIFAGIPGCSLSTAIHGISSPSICRYENNLFGNTDFSVQESSSKLIWKNKNSPSISQQSMVNSTLTCTTSNTTLPSSCDQKLHDSLNMPVRNGFVKSNLVDGYHTSKKGDVSRIPCSGSRMDELDSYIIPPLLEVVAQKSTFNLRAAQKFLFESYKETLLQSQDKSLYKNTKNKSSQLCESRSSQKNLMTTT